MASLLIPVTIKVTLIFCVAWGVTRAMRRRSAAARHLVWSAALLSALTMPMAQAAAPRWTLALLPAPAPADVAPVVVSEPVADVSAFPQDVGSPLEARPGSLPLSARMPSWPALLTGIWTAGALSLLLRLVLGVMWAGFISRRATPVSDPAWLATLEAARDTLGLTMPVRLRSTVRTTIPVACGILRPTVLLPAKVGGWSEERRWVVLIHELAHVRRRDCAVQLVAEAARALHWFNPFAHLAMMRLHAEQELACDDVVLACGGTRPATYADHLCEIADTFRRSATPLWATVAMARPSQLEGRVRAILDRQRDRRSPRRWFRVVVATSTCALMLPMGTLELSPAIPSTLAVVEAAAQQPPAAPVAPGRAAAPAQPPAPPAGPQTAAPPAPPAPAAQGRPAPVSLSEDTRRRVVDGLMAAVSDENVDVRRQALLSLTELRDPRVLPSLIKALGDSNNDVRRIAADAVTELITSENADAIVPALLPLLKDPDVDVRATAVRALGEAARPRRRSGFNPPGPPQVNLHLDSLQEAVERAQADAERHLERFWSQQSFSVSGDR